jgi:hypothetical protein
MPPLRDDPLQPHLAGMLNDALSVLGFQVVDVDQFFRCTLEEPLECCLALDVLELP